MGLACEQLRSLKDVSDDPDIADDTFLLAGRGLSYCPAIVLTPVTLPRLLDAATAGILVQHRHCLCAPQGSSLYSNFGTAFGLETFPPLPHAT